MPGDKDEMPTFGEKDRAPRRRQEEGEGEGDSPLPPRAGSLGDEAVIGATFIWLPANYRILKIKIKRIKERTAVT